MMAAALQGILFAVCLSVAAWTDIRSRTIPDIVSVFIAAVGLIRFSPTHLLGLLLAIPFFIAAARGRGGLGDALLIAASCFLLGPCRGIVGLILALSVFCIFHITARAVRMYRKKDRSQASMPLAPFLAAGFLAAYFI